MATQITLDSDQVLAIATQIEGDNQTLADLLNTSKSTIDALSAVWTGQASQDTISSYDTFSANFFKTYHDILNEYVKFLRTNVVAQYEQTEQANVKLADVFK